MVCKHPVASIVTERVVDNLEVVEVQEQHGERLAVLAPPPERVLDAIAEQRPVREVGNRIVEGLIGELLLELLALGDVAQVDDDPADCGVVNRLVNRHSVCSRRPSRWRIRNSNASEVPVARASSPPSAGSTSADPLR